MATNTSFTAMQSLVPGKAVDVLERDENGLLVGAYKGYWNDRQMTVTLYPNVHNKFVHWPGGAVSKKKTVSDRLVRCDR